MMIAACLGACSQARTASDDAQVPEQPVAEPAPEPEPVAAAQPEPEPAPEPEPELPKLPNGQEIAACEGAPTGMACIDGGKFIRGSNDGPENFYFLAVPEPSLSFVWMIGLLLFVRRWMGK